MIYKVKENKYSNTYREYGGSAKNFYDWKFLGLGASEKIMLNYVNEN